MRAISLFSGVGGFEIGFERAGIETVLQAERDPWCLEVLERHWPGTERVTDVRCVGVFGESARRGAADDDQQADHRRRREAWAGLPGSVDLVYGGFPCQDLSVAGKRAGLGGERSNLWFEFRRVVSELRPRYCVVENVPGLHSSAAGEDFTVVASGLVELGYGVAWRILDAQFFGVAQRRRRVFIVAARDADGRPGAERAAQVLSLCESCGGNPETGRTPREGLAYSLTAGVRGTGDGHGNAWNSNYVANPLGSHHRRDDLDNDTYITAPALAASGRGTARTGSSRGQDPLVLAVRTANTGANGHGIAEDVAHTLDGAQGQAIAGTLDLDTNGAYPITSMGVRRLTPRECERLMGWPDDWTRWAADGREIADSHRYRMCGNGVVAMCAEWIGHRLVAVDGALR